MQMQLTVSESLHNIKNHNIPLPNITDFNGINEYYGF